MSQACSSIVGQGVKIVLQIIPASNTRCATDDASPNNDEWYEMNIFGKLCQLVIATPFREGRHEAGRPKHFLPIVAQLEDLHKQGFVHGDIRAFNTVFDYDDDDDPAKDSLGYLIDFDFGGLEGKVTYPGGYQRFLEDGERIGYGNREIRKWHDWYAIGTLIFTIHKFSRPKGRTDGDLDDLDELDFEFHKHQHYWSFVNRDPPQEKITELMGFLSKLDDDGWKVEPSHCFAESLV